MWPFVAGFHDIMSSRFIQVNDIPLSGDTAFCLSLHQLVDISWAHFVWTGVQASRIYLTVELLGHLVTLFQGCTHCFPKYLQHSTSLPIMHESSNLPTSWPIPLLSIFFILAVLAGVKWVLVCISLRTSDKQHIKKQRHYFSDKGLYCQSYGFSSSQVRM